MIIEDEWSCVKVQGYTSRVEMEFTAEAISWRGPAPFVFVPVPEDIAAEIKAVSKRASYGWGVIPVIATIGSTEYTTSLFPKNGSYLVPVKVVVQRAEGVDVGSQVTVRMRIDWR